MLLKNTLKLDNSKAWRELILLEKAIALTEVAPKGGMPSQTQLKAQAKKIKGKAATLLPVGPAFLLQVKTNLVASYPDLTPQAAASLKKRELFVIFRDKNDGEVCVTELGS